jgi:hypothetical protein
LARKCKRLKDLRSIDVNSEAYWEEVLRREGLSEDDGRDPGHRKLLYVGDSNTLNAFQEMKVRKQTGQVKPKGNGPDKFVDKS